MKKRLAGVLAGVLVLGGCESIQPRYDVVARVQTPDGVRPMLVTNTRVQPGDPCRIHLADGKTVIVSAESVTLFPAGTFKPQPQPAAPSAPPAASAPHFLDLPPLDHN